LEVAKENENIAIERFRLGASDFLVLREAQRNLVDANGRFLDAMFSTKLAEIELLRLSGNLLPAEVRR
jgi:outer membrane protein TolC